MDRIERIGPRTPPWPAPALDPDRDVLAERRRREEERRRRRAHPQPETPDAERDPLDDDPPHHIDVRA